MVVSEGEIYDQTFRKLIFILFRGSTMYIGLNEYIYLRKNTMLIGIINRCIWQFRPIQPGYIYSIGVGNHGNALDVTAKFLSIM